jgi:hypothetical protein
MGITALNPSTHLNSTKNLMAVTRRAGMRKAAHVIEIKSYNTNILDSPKNQPDNGTFATSLLIMNLFSYETCHLERQFS